MPCGHPIKSGETRCHEPDCHKSITQYFRRYRAIAKERGQAKLTKARREGAEDLRIKILERLEGDLAELELNGGSAGEIVRAIGLD